MRELENDTVLMKYTKWDDKSRIEHTISYLIIKGCVSVILECKWPDDDLARHHITKILYDEIIDLRNDSAIEEVEIFEILNMTDTLTVSFSEKRRWKNECYLSYYKDINGNRDLGIF